MTVRREPLVDECIWRRCPMQPRLPFGPSPHLEWRTEERRSRWIVESDIDLLCKARCLRREASTIQLPDRPQTIELPASENIQRSIANTPGASKKSTPHTK